MERSTPPTVHGAWAPRATDDRFLVLRHIRPTAAEKTLAESTSAQRKGVQRTLRGMVSALAPRLRDGTTPATYILLAVVFAGWLAAVVYTVRHLTGREALDLLPILILTALVQPYKLRIYASKVDISLGVVGKFAAGMLFGIPGAVVCSTVSATVSGLMRINRRNPQPFFRPLFFNFGASSLANIAGVAAFVGLSRAFPISGDIRFVPSALLAGAVVYLSECTFQTLLVTLRQGRPPRQVWEENFRWLLPYWLGMALLGLGVALAYRSAGLVGLLAFTAPALLMRYAMKQYLDRTTRSVEALRARNDELERANREIAAMSERLQETYAGTLEALVAALDARDQEVNGHSARVSQLTMVLAKQLGVPEGTQEWIDIERGALLHDIGKIGVTDAILRKPAALTDDEWAQMRGHARIGYQMLKDIPFLVGASAIVACHHERWDGRGYPRGLAGEQIPFGARIFALADTFDAMATNRPYRKARPYEDCLAEITRCAGTQFDPAAVEALQAVYPRWVELHQQGLARASVGRLTVVA
jgi:HD domain